MSRATRRVGLRGRLLALVLIPTLVAALLAGNAAADKRHAAQVASDVHVEVGGLLDLVAVRTAMMSARIPVEVEVRSAALGLDPKAVLGLLDLDGQRFGDLSAVQEQLRAMPERIRPFAPEELDGLRREIERGASPQVIDRFTQLEEQTDEAWAAELALVQHQTEALGHPELGDLLRDLDRSARATSAMAATVTGLADYWFADMQGAQRTETARVQLGIADDRFDRLTSSLARSNDPGVARAAASLRRAKTSGPFQVAIDDAVNGRPAGPFVDGVDLGLMVGTFTDSFDLVEPSLALMDGRAAALVADGVADTFGALLDRFDEADVLDLLQERVDVAAFAGVFVFQFAAVVGAQNPPLDALAIGFVTAFKVTAHQGASVEFGVVSQTIFLV